MKLPWIAAGLCASLLAISFVGSQLTIRSLKGDISDLKAELVTERANLKQCRANVETLDKSRVSQNAAVDLLKAESDARAKAAEKAAQEALRARDGAVRSITAMLNTPPKGDLCAAADAFILKWAGIQ